MGIWLFWVMILVFSIVLFIVPLKGNAIVSVSLFVKAIDRQLLFVNEMETIYFFKML